MKKIQTNKSMTVYCISGLGADERAFYRLSLKYKMNHVQWKTPLENESIKEYAARLSEEIVEENAVIIGLSMGGIIAAEICRLKPVKKLILISSIKSTAEKPPYFKATKYIPIQNHFPLDILKNLGSYLRPLLGGIDLESRNLINGMLQDADDSFVRWGMNAILEWESDAPRGTQIYHIHGDRDLLFPHIFVKNALIVKGGTHSMILLNAAKVSMMINNILRV